LPVIDCLPFKKGNNILALRQMPADAIPDKVEISFTYKKGQEEKVFTSPQYPDSTWQIEPETRKDVIVEKGKNNQPLINDFSLTDVNGNDSTEAILSQHGKYYLFFLNKLDRRNVFYWIKGFADIKKKAKDNGENIYVITSDREKVDSFMNVKQKYNVPIYTSDVTAIKTAARATPTLFLMDGPVIEDKWGAADIESASK